MSNEMLRDRLVCGVNDTHIKSRLISEVNLDFDRALAMAHAIEMADRDAEQLQDGGQGNIRAGQT